MDIDDFGGDSAQAQYNDAMSRRTRWRAPVLAMASALLIATFGSLVSAPTVHAFVAVREDQRVDQLTQQFVTDSFATHNAFGGAFGSLFQGSYQGPITSAVSSGAISWLFEMRDLADLTGTNAASFHIGVVNGAPVISGGNPYNGNSDLDWWYAPDLGDLDGGGVPTHQLSASIASHSLSGSGGSADLNFATYGDLHVSTVVMAAAVDSPPTHLTVASGYSPPGYPSTDPVDPTQVTFPSMSAGQLKFNLSAASLASTSIPTSLQGTKCSQAFTSSSTWLDVLVAGCSPGFGTAVSPTQPDQSDPAAAVAGAGAPYVLTLTHNVVSGCKDKNGTLVVLQTCLHAAAYSDYLSFTTDRVIGKAPQYLSFTSTPPAAPHPGDQYQAMATGGASGNVVVFSIGGSSTAGACSTSAAGAVSFLKYGLCVVDADQSGNANYFGAPTVSQSITIPSRGSANPIAAATPGSRSVLPGPTASPGARLPADLLPAVGTVTANRTPPTTADVSSWWSRFIGLWSRFIRLRL